MAYQGYDTREAVEKRRRIADALLASAVQNPAQSIGEGIGQLGKAFFGYAGAMANDRQMREGRESGNRAFEAVARALGGQQATPRPETPIETTALPGAFDPAAIGQRIGAPDPIAASAAAAGIDPEAWARQVRVESGGNPNAVSPAGATGVAQIMPATARDPGFGVPAIFEVAQALGRQVPDQTDATLQALLRDPEVNATFGARYQRAMLDRFGGDPRLAAAAYNAGPGAVEQHGGVPPFAETQRYVENVQPRLAGQPVEMAAAGVPSAPPQTQPAMSRIAMLMEAAGNDWMSDGQRGVVNALLQRELASPEASAAMREYELARSQGFGGSFMDYRTQLAQAGRTSVNVNNNPAPPVDPMAAANAEARGRGLNALATSAVETFNEGRNVATQLAQIDQLEGLLARTPTGTVPAWQQWATEVLGVQATGGPAQAASAIINNLIPQQRPPGSGTSSDRDVAMFRASLPSLVNTPQGNAEIIAGMRAIAEYRAEIARIAGDATAGVIPYADRNAQSDMIRQMREADARLSAALRQRREANPEMYGQPFDAEAERRRLRELQEGGL